MLEKILNNNVLLEALADPFEFSLPRRLRDYDWITLKPSVPFEAIAGDSTGGVFLAYGTGALEHRPILHASSEGQAGKIANNLAEWLTILMAIPYWHDLLKFSGDGQLHYMRQAATFMEEEFADEYPELPEMRALICTALSIPMAADPIQQLHANVLASDCTVIDDNGLEWDSLFNDFTPADNPMWR